MCVYVYVYEDRTKQENELTVFTRCKFFRKQNGEVGAVKNSFKEGMEVMQQIRPELFKADLGILLNKRQCVKDDSLRKRE